MAETPAGILSLPLAHLRRLVSESAEFQSWVGAGSAAAALDNIYLVNVPETGLVRPFALVGFGDKWKWEDRAMLFDTEGELFLVFEADVSSGNAASEADAQFEFANAVGAVLSDMFALAGTDDYLKLSKVEYAKPPARVQPEDAEISEDYYSMELSVYWSGI